MLRRFWRSENPAGDAGDRLYAAIVAAARRPAFYRSLAVPDTIDGRFDLIVLHLALLFHRLEAEGEAGKTTSQTVFDLFFRDMDRSLREMGVGDFGLPRRIRAMGEGVYGRLAAYRPPLAAGDRAEIATALSRNVYAGSGEASGNADLLADYVLAASAALNAMEGSAIVGGTIAFPEPLAARPEAEAAE